MEILFNDSCGLPICPICGEVVTIGEEPCGFNDAEYVASCGCYIYADNSYTGALEGWVDWLSHQKIR